MSVPAIPAVPKQSVAPGYAGHGDSAASASDRSHESSTPLTLSILPLVFSISPQRCPLGPVDHLDPSCPLPPPSAPLTRSPCRRLAASPLHFWLSTRTHPPTSTSTSTSPSAPTPPKPPHPARPARQRCSPYTARLHPFLFPSTSPGPTFRAAEQVTLARPSSLLWLTFRVTGKSRPLPGRPQKSLPSSSLVSSLPTVEMASKQDIPVIIHNGKRGLLTIEDGRLDVLQLSADGRLRLLLRAVLGPAPTGVPTSPTRKSDCESLDGAKRILDIHALVQKGAKSSHLHYTKIRMLVEPRHFADAEQWVDQLMAAAYPVTKPYRRVLLLVNPVGGKGKGMVIAKHTIIPILEAAGCKVDMRETRYRYHAEEICKEADLSKVDVIAVASGDGGYYEAFNGLAGRPDGRKALRTPIAPLPTGSACAACTNLFGPKDNFNVALATLNVIKGQPMPIDLQSVVLLPSRERRVSFLSVALGLMVDLDLGTENLRWMGDSRFVYGYIRGVVQSKSCKARITLDIVEDDKEKMAREAREAALAERGTRTLGGGTDPLQLIRGVQSLSVASQAVAKGDAYGDGHTPSSSRKTSDSPETPHVPGQNSHAEGNESSSTALMNGSAHPATEALPPVGLVKPTSSWTTVDSSERGRRASKSAASNKWQAGDSLLFLYRDLNQWPVARAGSGVIDIVLQRTAARSTLLSQASVGHTGDPYWLESMCYYKVRAYTVENLDKEKQPLFTVDGEAFEWDSFHVEVLPRAATLLALDGHYYQGEFVEQAPSVGAGKAKKPLCTALKLNAEREKLRQRGAQQLGDGHLADLKHEADAE
ncbi:unnamed protein product [Cutaneotrichosporon oleaginosum]